MGLEVGTKDKKPSVSSDRVKYGKCTNNTKKGFNGLNPLKEELTYNKGLEVFS